MTNITKLVLFSLLLTSSLPLAAATRRRAVQLVPGVETTVTGVVTDSSTHAVIVQAEIAAGRLKVTTDKDGKYTITLPTGKTTVLNVNRSGYEAATLSVTPSGPTTLNTSLKPTATVRVITTGGATYELDRESAQFAYALPFAGYAKSDSGNFCLADGTTYAPVAADLAKVIGPATSGTATPCCKNPVMSITLEKKSGERVQAAFVDSCPGYEVDFIGRDHTSAQYRYLRFTEIAQIVFP